MIIFCYKAAPNKNSNSKSSSKDLTTKNGEQKSEKSDKSKKHHDGSSASNRTTFSGSKRKHGEDDPNVNTSTSSSSSSSTTNNSYTNVPMTYPLTQSSSPYRPPLNTISNLIDSDSTSEDERSAAYLEQHENNIDKLNDFKVIFKKKYQFFLSFSPLICYNSRFLMMVIWVLWS